MNTEQPSISNPVSNTISAKPHALSTKELVIAGMFAALLAVLSQISIPMPTGVPITIQVFSIALTGVILGPRLGLLAVAAYILLGACGLPIFAGLKGGIQMLAGFTGGYIWSWPAMVTLAGIRFKTSRKSLNTILSFVFALLGLAVNELAGGLQWAALSGEMSAGAVFSYAMVAFIPKDIILILLAVSAGLPMSRLLARIMKTS